ncbi:O-methyltransferase [Methylocystis heyeri]|uniref:Methyltransferase n=1 Tax=Methylocystis heyeri TaxID=391905 RepID=A0A6B8KFA0_9HYPH|nr:O-methyltransferase [Methylocystis heyeri]QGM46377.1 methyltransferase [Methylocystis heyeri]
MQERDFAHCDQYIDSRLISADEAQGGTIEANKAAGLPQIDVSPAQGKFLYLLARSMGARNILEIGTLGGYSTIWLARALPPGGRAITLEYDQKHAETARANIAREGLGDRVDIRVGAALDLLPKLQEEGFGPVDFFFIDADKENNADYFDWALKFARPGSLIVVDNVIRAGAVADLANSDSTAVAARALFERVSAEPRVSATALQTVGSKGWDGFLLASVN